MDNHINSRGLLLSVHLLKSADSPPRGLPQRGHSAASYCSISHCWNELCGIVEGTPGHFSLLGFIPKSQSAHVYPFGKFYNELHGWR